MNGLTSSSVSPPAYPALASCLVIESRTSYRAELRNKLTSTQLFEQLYEPVTLEAGLDSIRTQSFDACVIGASVTPKSTAWFLGAAPSTSKSSECAFLRIRRSDRPPLSELFVTAHAELDWPCSRQALFDSMVQAVIAANSSSPWRTIAGSTKYSFNQPLASVQVRNVPSSTAPSSAQGSVATMLLNTEGLLSDIAAGLQNGRYRMDQRGEPTEFTRVAIVQVVDKVLGGPASRPDTGSEGDESDAGWMHAVLVAEFSVWAAEYVREGSAAATRNLKRRLVQQLSAL